MPTKGFPLEESDCDRDVPFFGHFRRGGCLVDLFVFQRYDG